MQYEIKKFKDGQITAKLLTEDDLCVSIRGNTYEELFSAASVKEAWDSAITKNASSELNIACLISQRSDRRFNDLESFDLKVVAQFINSMGFDRVNILHPHSGVTLALIHNSKAISHFRFVEKAFKDSKSDCIVSPDAGAYKSTYDISIKLGCEMIASNKFRDKKGSPVLNVSGTVLGKSCLIVDDLADGGRTFKYLAEKLKRLGASKVFLYVTHGQFNFGFDELKQTIDRIYTTDSFRSIDNDFVTQYFWKKILSELQPTI